ncbi:hypothetical protein ACJJID_10895 [Microbulbifer sp. CnH-101-G]|uniref:hypothetical protein n=1 Tax=Microbulbifer sp. CnH-101-G TaxID=3243393 RepID=UPI00403A5F29
MIFFALDFSTEAFLSFNARKYLMKFPTPKTLISAISLSVTLGSSIPALSQVTDSAQSMITLSFVESIVIDNVNDLNITPTGANSPATGLDLFCVAGSGFPTFSITFGSASMPFELSNANADTINYDVFFDNGLSGTITQAFAGVAIPGQMILNSDCTADNAAFEVSIPASEWQPVQNQGPFIGNLSILVASE